MHKPGHRPLGQKTEAALSMIRRKGLATPADLARLGIPRGYLARLTHRGLVRQVGRGLYAWPGLDLGEHQSLLEAARLVPAGVICLLSALQFHGLTTQVPHEVWLALPPGAWRPSPAHLKLRVSRFSGRAFSYGIRVRRERGIPLRVYSPAKTVADCFKFRNKVGLDVAIEALREGLRGRLFAVDELWEAAGVVRMRAVLRPYLEAVA
ncbi:MAG: type IV toxin-antitoxin system AbiEi family antitoxin domain-containing protein [Isosphaeraceae bacterium]